MSAISNAHLQFLGSQTTHFNPLSEALSKNQVIKITSYSNIAKLIKDSIEFSKSLTSNPPKSYTLKKINFYSPTNLNNDEFNNNFNDYVDELIKIEDLDIEKINVKHSIIDDNHLIALLKRFPNLKSLNIGSGSKLTEEGFKSIAEDGKNLESLKFDFTRGISEATIIAVVKNCKRLKTLYLHGVSQITSAGFQAIAENCPNLEKFDFSRTEINDADLEAFGTHCKSIKSINIIYATKFTDKGFKKILNRNVETINLLSNEILTDESLIEISNVCPNLKTAILGISYMFGQKFTSNGMMHIVQKCKKLEELILPVLKNDTSELLIQFGKNSTNLRALDLNCFNANHNLTDEIISLFAKNNPHLTNINLNFAKGPLSDPALLSIAEHCPDLEELKLQYCKNIGGSGLVEIAKKCKKLKHLDLRGCKLDRESLIEFSKYATNLLSLNLEDCKNVTDLVLNNLSANSKELNFLTLMGCVEITDQGIGEFLKAGAPKLSYINVQSCTKISQDGFRQLKQSKIENVTPSKYEKVIDSDRSILK